MKCEKCGFPIKPGDEIMVYGVLKHRDCFGAMIDLVEAAEGRIAELETQLAALRAAGEQEKKYELGRLALLAGVVANDEVSAHEMSEQIAQAIITLRAQLAAGEWRPVSEPPGAGMDVEVIVRALIKPNGNYRIVLPALQWRPARDEIDTLWAQLTENITPADVRAIGIDWKAIGKDLLQAVEKYGEDPIKPPERGGEGG